VFRNLKLFVDVTETDLIVAVHLGRCVTVRFAVDFDVRRLHFRRADRTSQLVDDVWMRLMKRRFTVLAAYTTTQLDTRPVFCLLPTRCPSVPETYATVELDMCRIHSWVGLVQFQKPHMYSAVAPGKNLKVGAPSGAKGEGQRSGAFFWSCPSTFWL